MDFEYVVDEAIIESRKSKLKQNYDILIKEKNKLNDEILKEKEKIYIKEYENLKNEVKEALNDYANMVNDECDSIYKSLIKPKLKAVNKLYKINIDGSTKILDYQKNMNDIILDSKKRVSDYEKKLDEIDKNKEKILDMLENVKNYESKKENGYQGITSENIVKLENELAICNKKINNYWTENKVISKEELKRINDIEASEPSVKVVDSVNGILHLGDNIYKDEEITQTFPIFKTKDSFSTLVSIKNNSEMIMNNLKNFVYSYILRMLFALDVTKMQINIIDTKEIGMLFSNITTLVNSFPDILSEKVVFNEYDIEKELIDLNENMISRGKLLNNNDIFEYNKTADQKLNIQVYVINNFESVFKNNVKLFENILKIGHKYGIYAVLICDTDLDFSKYKDMLYSIHKLNFKYDNFEIFKNCSASERNNIRDIIKLSCNLSRIKIEPGKMLIYKDNSFVLLENNKIFSEYKNVAFYLFNEKACKSLVKNLSGYMQKLEIKRQKENELNLDELISKLPRNQTTENMIKIPIGVNLKGEFEYIEFSDNSVDAILTGKSGAGKSKLYHYILLNALYMYPAEELKIYILDLKEAVEFSIYSNYYLPNIEGIYGNRTNPIEILEYLSDEITRRSELFTKENNARDILEYRKSGKKLPRILLILDEFHIILGDSNKYNEKAKECLTRIITQGRAEGIHIIMCSQDITSNSGLSNNINQQLTTKILLRSIESSADTLLIFGNSYGDMKKSEIINEVINLPKGIGIVNKSSGDIRFNEKFRFPNITSLDLEKHLKLLSDENAKNKITFKPIFKSSFENNISELEKIYFEEKLNFSKYPVAIIASYMKFKNSNINITFSKKNSNIYICTASNSKIDLILQSFFVSLNIWNRYNKNMAKVHILDFDNINQKYIQNIEYIELLKYNNNVEELNLKLEEIKKSKNELIPQFLVVNRLDKFKEYYDNQYDCSDEIMNFIENIKDFYENSKENNVVVLTIGNGGSSGIDNTMIENSKFYLFEEGSIFSNEYYINLYNRKTNLLYKNIDEMPNLSVEVNLYVDSEK